MSVPLLVQRFYDEIWNAGNLAVVADLLAPGFRFRGSLGVEVAGHAPFIQYVHDIREALADYRCDVLACVAEGDQAFAQMRFSGRHVRTFRGRAPTRRQVDWLGAALFRFEADTIAELWVLGDLARLDAQLSA
jgi:predicted ester cyclase